MAEDQSANIINTISMFASAGIGAIIGVLAQQRISRARPSLHVTSCELSSVLLSRVDYLEMPTTIAKKFNSFPWKLTLDEEQISSNANILPIGYAQENYYFLKEFLPIADQASELIKKELTAFEEGEEKKRKESITRLLHNSLILRLLIGKTKRSSFSVFRDARLLESLDISEDNAILPWAIDDASGVGKGTYGAFTIHIQDSRITFPFQWEDEKKRMETISFLLASLHEEAVPTIMRELIEELNEDRATANDVYRWFKDNIDVNSTFVCNVTITNMGKRPALFSGEGLLLINMPDREVLKLPCYSESYTEGTEEEKSVTRTVKVLRAISNYLDIALPVRKKVVTEKLLVPGGDHINITLRTNKAVSEIPEGRSLLSLYKSKKLTAKLQMKRENNTNSSYVESPNFVFSSSVE